ncbi:MAG: serine hydrolase [Chitinophagaceae bacterium]|nr:serine hydrolase [Chitinophagaceae bacterium]
MKRIFFLLLIISAHHISNAQSWQDTIDIIDKMFDRYKPGNPGCQLAISRNGQVIFSRAWGMADLEHAVPLTTESVIEAGSISKQFTAAAILLLEQQGKLAIDDDVRKYVPELPDYGTPITLRQMMQHTSGLKDWGSIAEIAGWPRSTKTYNNDDALYIIARQKTLNNKPGDEFLYSNSNYNLFAVIVERVSGISLAQFTRLHIFEPAGMKHTEWRNNFKKVVLNRAMAYERSGTGYLTNMPNEYVYGNGGLLTTAEDLLIWNDYYLNGKLGNPSLLKKQLAVSALNNGKMNWYAAGLFTDSLRGRKTISHSGATAGYRSNLYCFPDLGLTIVWLSNTSEFDQVGSPVNSIRDLLVTNISVVKNINELPPVTIPIEKLNSYTGWYKDPRTGLALKLFVRDGRLANSRGGNLIPVAENVFMSGPNKIEILPVKPSKLRFITPVDTLHFFAVDSAKPDEKTMNDYAGKYYSEEAEAKFDIIFKDGKLVASRNPTSDYLFSPTYKDGFSSPAGDIYFERDKKLQVTSMKISVGRARNVEFRKMKTERPPILSTK